GAGDHQCAGIGDASTEGACVRKERTILNRHTSTIVNTSTTGITGVCTQGAISHRQRASVVDAAARIPDVSADSAPEQIERAGIVDATAIVRTVGGVAV